MRGVHDPRYGFRITVQRADDGSAMPVVMAPNGVPYVISEPGTEYDVAVDLDRRSSMWRRVPPGGRLQISLTIDGKGVGYNKLCSPDTTSTTFDGFCTYLDAHGGSSEYKRFMFAPLASGGANGTSGPTVADPEAIPAGRMVVTFTALLPTGQYRDPAAVSEVGGRGGGGGRLPEGKKFFLAPSMQTAQGRFEARSQSWDTEVYTTVATLATTEVRYDSASTLLLRGTLSKANVAHRALLRASRDPGVRALVGDDDNGGAPRAAGVKRERGDSGGDAGGGGAGGPGGGGSVFLDLTKAPTAPLMVGGRALGADEVAVCDLAGDDDDDGGGGGGGRWQVRKKAAVEVEGGDEAGAGEAEGY